MGREAFTAGIQLLALGFDMKKLLSLMVCVSGLSAFGASPSFQQTTQVVTSLAPRLIGTNVMTDTNRYTGVVVATNVNNTFAGSGAGLTSIPQSGVTSLAADLSSKAATNETRRVNLSNNENRFVGTVTNGSGDTSLVLSGGTLTQTNSSDANQGVVISDTGNLGVGTANVGGGVKLAIEVPDENKTPFLFGNATAKANGADGFQIAQLDSGVCPLFMYDIDGGYALFEWRLNTNRTVSMLDTNLSSDTYTRIYTQGGTLYTDASPRNQTISEQEWNAASGRAIANGIDGKSVGNTTIYTVPTDRQFIVQRVLIIPTTVDTLAVLPTVSVGKTGAGYVDIIAAAALTGVTAINTVSILSPIAGGSVLNSGEGLVLRVSVGATATTFTFKAIAIGILL